MHHKTTMINTEQYCVYFNVIPKIHDDWSILQKLKKHENRHTNILFLDPNDIETGPSVDRVHSSNKKKV